jgi:divalent metal cation (Fe/Co/Zn/Cd) transporter
MEQAHVLSSNIEKTIKGVFPNIDRIDIHEEPA